MKIWNHIWLGAVIVSLALALAGCGGSSGSSSSKAASVATSAPSTAGTPATTATTTSTAAKPPAATAKSTSSGKPSATAKSKPTTTPAKAPAASASSKAKQQAKAPPTFGKIALTSSAFKAGSAIPARYTCDGGSVSPPLEWHGVPHGTAELFLLAIDLSGSASDAIQWAVGGIPPGTTSLPAGSLPAGAVAGMNSAGKAGWAGICGAKGQLHHVAFLFYALSHKLGLKSGFSPIVARNGLKSATLATGLTVATYQRP